MPKRRTPLADAPFAGISVATHRLALLRRALGAKAELRADSPRWSYVEHLLARATLDAGTLAVDVWRDEAEIAALWQVDRRFDPTWSVDRRESKLARWRQAVGRSLGWAP